MRSPSPLRASTTISRRGRRCAGARRGAAYLIALSTRLASAWLTSSRLPCTGAAARRLDLELEALLVGERLVELANAARDLGRIELGHVVARLAGFRTRDHQQRVEGADQRIRFLDRPLERRAVLRFVLGQAQRLLGSGCAAGSAAS